MFFFIPIFTLLALDKYILNVKLNLMFQFFVPTLKFILILIILKTNFLKIAFILLSQTPLKQGKMKFSSNFFRYYTM